MSTSTGLESHPLYEIATHAARALWICQWSNERGRRDGTLPDLDTAPETPEAYLAEAFCFLGSLPDPPGFTLAEFARCNDGKRPSEEDFGHYAAMQSMGHGVSLADDWNIPTGWRGETYWHPGHYLEDSALNAADYMEDEQS